MSHMAAVLTGMLHELQHDLTCLSHGKLDEEPYVSIAEMQDGLIDGIMGLEALVRADRREPFSA